MRRTLDDLIRNGLRLTERFNVKSLTLDSSQSTGAGQVSKVVENGGLAVGIGPPGTGKTVIFNVAQADVIDGIEDDEVLVHVAPTNQLVEETAVRTIALLFSKGFSDSDLRTFIRVYGSRFEAQKISEDVKLVYTTGYQPGALRKLASLKKRVHIMVDEASTTALHEAFIPLSMALAEEIRKGDIEFVGSFSVIGDPMQAIVGTESWRWKYEQLIVYRMTLSLIPKDERESILEDPPALFELAEKYANDSKIRYFFLNKTYRMPSPTENIVSIPFYKRRLVAAKDYLSVLKNILVEDPRAQGLARDSKLLGKVKDCVDNALDSNIPVIYIEDSGNAYQSPRVLPGLDEFDKIRSVLAAEIAAYIALRTNIPRISLITPYNEMAIQTQLYVKTHLSKHLGNRISDLSFSTVHSSLGSEADIVVVIMGKEYGGSEEYSSKMRTIYFQAPELVNVQFSRHSSMLVIIGNIEKLAKQMSKDYAYVSKIMDALKELEEKDVVSRTSI